MNLADSLAPSSVGKSAQHLALGFFDGLHLGHQRVILGGKIPHPPAATAVLTFRDHPLSILHPERHPALITGDNPDPVLHAGTRISSSRIRESIQKGNLEEASSMLGRPFTLLGRVVTGDGRGKEIGFPTANLKTEDECLPPDGVFAGRALLPEKKTYIAAINLGTRPTFNGLDRRIEAHLIGYSGDLTGAEIDLEFHRFIRPEMKFHDAQSLSAQIKSDLKTISG
ncbi:MAG: hypothetical protein EBU36_00150 [Verrucomicrobia bacterium]|nr:hypothetical protein [Verrucomicrobiota bacterium]